MDLHADPRSPISNSSTSGPSAATVPMYSWPGVKFLLKGSPPSMLAGDPRMNDLEIGCTDRNRIDPDQDFGA